MTNRRWSCPAGKHPGILAPAKLRKNDVRRFCLACCLELDKGPLVERTCSAKEASAEKSKARAARKARSKSAAKRRVREAAKERKATREVVDGIDVARELDRIWAYAIRFLPESKTPPPVPALTVSRSRTGRWANSERGASGRAFSGQHRVHLTIGIGCKRLRLCGVLAHEAAHLIVPGEGHSDVFWSTLCELAREAFGVEIPFRMDGDKFAKQAIVEQCIAACPWLMAGERPPRKPAVPRHVGRAKVRSVREV